MFNIERKFFILHKKAITRYFQIFTNHFFTYILRNSYKILDTFIPVKTLAFVRLPYVLDSRFRAEFHIVDSFFCILPSIRMSLAIDGDAEHKDGNNEDTDNCTDDDVALRVVSASNEYTT